MEKTNIIPWDLKSIIYESERKDRVLGKGPSGKILKAFDSKNKRYIAIKVLELTSIDEKELDYETDFLIKEFAI